MAILNNSNAISTAGGYDINNSLRFRSSASAYLNRTPASAGNRQKFTLSFWAKRGSLGSPQTILSGGATGGTGTAQFIGFDTDNTFFFSNFGVGNVQTTQVFRDPSAWYHIVVAIDTTQATAANRVIFYVNGIQVTSYSATTYPAQNTNLYINTNEIQTIGRASYSALYYNDGYLTEYNFIDGSALTPSSFGETDTTTGVWKPKAYTGTYGTNGFYLKFSDIATTSGSNAGLGKDFSGNTNYWTTNNISVTAGTTYDAMIDSPTLTSATVANYCVMNPIGGNSSMTLLNGNLNTSATAYSLHRYGTIGVSSGKYYWEVSPTAMSGASNGMLVGISNDIQETGATFNGARGYFSNNGYAYTGTSGVAYGATWTTNDIIGMALDLNAGTLTFYKNNVSQGTAFTGLTGEWFPLIRTDATVTSFINFGQRPFAYTPPTGFVRLNTYNLPDSTIKKGNTVMDATLYTGNGSTQTITNAAGFKPDAVWVKGRNTTFSHMLSDSVRGVTNALYPNLTNAEGGSDFTAFNSNGFSVNSGATVNQNTSTYVGWQWQAGQGTTSSNTSGSITSTVSVNTTAGFSVVTFNTGTIASSATVGHGLGVAPKMVILKTRAITGTWVTYHADVGNTKYLELNNTMAAATASTIWNNTSPTSSVFTIGSAFNNQGNYVAYCWAEIAGFSKFTSYTGNGSTDGPFVFCNFRPKFVMIKRTVNAGGSWAIYDTARNTYNVANLSLYPNLSSADDTYDVLDFTSNGFKIRTSSLGVNQSGDTFIVAAFAESPFKNSNAR